MNKEKLFKHQHGFIALISAIVIMAIFLIIAFTLSTSGFFLRFNVLDSEFKKTSLGLAEACVQKAMLKLAQTPTYDPSSSEGECMNVSGNVSDDCAAPARKNVCKICSVSTAGSQKTINARAVYNGSYSNVTAIVSQDAYGNFTVNSWDEQPNYSGLPCPVP